MTSAPRNLNKYISRAISNGETLFNSEIALDEPQLNVLRLKFPTKTENARLSIGISLMKFTYEY